MRIALMYPPPRKIPSRPAAPAAAGTAGQGPDGNESDFRFAPYGLLSLAAQAMRNGRQVKTFNLSNLPWDEVEGLIRRLDADVYGMTCFTSNRRGVALTADCIRAHHRDAHIVVGGPHATALPAKLLEHHGSIDTVVIGEGEQTFDELVARLEAGRPTAGLPGTAWRGPDGVQIGPKRERIADLDSLAAVQDYFPCSLLLTSRGCPGQCTFCAGSVIWARRMSFHSAEYVLDAIEKILASAPIKRIVIKDDTFTANRKRALRICRGILDRKLNFLWGCDTRADVLDEELLRAMRLAGCTRISLGVESASPKVLRNIRKKVTPEQVLAATRTAKKFGLRVKYFMIAGNRGEDAAAFRESVEFLRTAEPHEYVYSVLTVYPGTEEFEIFKAKGRLNEETFFQTDSPEVLITPEEPIMRQLMRDHLGRNYRMDGAEHYRAVLDELPDLHAAHLDLGAAYFREGQVDLAEHHIREALDLGYPVPDLAANYLAGLAGRRGGLEAMRAELRQAAEGPHPHPVIVRNLEALDSWLAAGGRGSGSQKKLDIIMRHDFEVIPAETQPIVPAPLAEDDWQWPAGDGGGAAQLASPQPATVGR